MANTLAIVFSIVLGALSIFAIILAFAYHSLAILGIGAVILIISTISLIYGLTREKKEAPPEVKTTIKVKPKKVNIQQKKGPESQPPKIKPVKPVEATVLPPDTIYCPYCGKQIPADSAFCPNCGASLLD
ncbi:MAG: zinc-ribbon domain-containing protein [Candidatus Freyarchaeota archaeon]